MCWYLYVLCAVCSVLSSHFVHSVTLGFRIYASFCFSPIFNIFYFENAGLWTGINKYNLVNEYNDCGWQLIHGICCIHFVQSIDWCSYNEINSSNVCLSTLECWGSYHHIYKLMDIDLWRANYYILVSLKANNANCWCWTVQTYKIWICSIMLCQNLVKIYISLHQSNTSATHHFLSDWLSHLRHRWLGFKSWLLHKS